MANKKQTTNEGTQGRQSPIGGTQNAGQTQSTNLTGGSTNPSQSTSPSASNPSTTTGQFTPERSGTGQSGSGHVSSAMTSRSSAGESAGAGTAVARTLYEQAKETAGHAYELAAEKATTKLEEQKTTLSGGLSTIADSVRKVGENLRGPDVQEGINKYTAEYSGKAAEKIENVANYFEQKSVRDMYSDLENFARRNPMAFIGGAFALGLITARFLKSSSSRPMAGSGVAFKEAAARSSIEGSQGGGTYR